MVAGFTGKPCLWTVIPNQDKRLRGWGGGGERRRRRRGEMREETWLWQRMNTLFSVADSYNRAIITNLPCRPIHITMRLLKRLISATGVKVLHTGDSQKAPGICISKLPPPRLVSTSASQLSSALGSHRFCTDCWFWWNWQSLPTVPLFSFSFFFSPRWTQIQLCFILVPGFIFSSSDCALTKPPHRW